MNKIITKVRKRDGRIVDFEQEKITNVISKALTATKQGDGKKAEKLSKESIRLVLVNVGGAHIFFTNSHGLISVSRADQKISQEDIERVIQAAQTFSLPSNKEILSVIPKEFIIDNEKGIKELENRRIKKKGRDL